MLLRGTPHAKPHLWLVLTEPDGDPAETVAVMVRSRKAYTDDTVVLAPGDHPFIHRASSVHYSTARRLRVDRILRRIRSGQCHLKEDLEADLLARVREGLMTSPFTVNAVREYCRNRFPAGGRCP